MTKQQAYTKVMTTDKRIERLERYSERIDELQYLLCCDFNMYDFQRNSDRYYEVDQEIGQEITDMLSNILDRINVEIGYIEKEAAA